MGRQRPRHRQQGRLQGKFGLPFTLLADEDHEVAERYGTWVEKQNYGRNYMGVKRSTFLVDPDGRIARVWPTRQARRATPREVLAALDEERAPSASRQHKMRHRPWGETSDAPAEAYTFVKLRATQHYMRIYGFEMSSCNDESR